MHDVHACMHARTHTHMQTHMHTHTHSQHQLQFNTHKVHSHIHNKSMHYTYRNMEVSLVSEHENVNMNQRIRYINTININTVLTSFNFLRLSMKSALLCFQPRGSETNKVQYSNVNRRTIIAWTVWQNSGCESSPHIKKAWFPKQQTAHGYHVTASYNTVFCSYR